MISFRTSYSASFMVSVYVLFFKRAGGRWQVCATEHPRFARLPSNGRQRRLRKLANILGTDSSAK
jgi:hypothetical protein